MSALPLFVASRARVKELLPALQLQHKGEWKTIYRDPTTSVEWILYPLWDYHGPGPDCLRRGSPSLQEVLACIESSAQDSEVSAAAFHLANEPPGTKENLSPLIDKLEELAKANPSQRALRNIALAIAWSQADRPFNHRSPEGKTMQQVNADYSHFSALASRAAVLKEKAEALLGHVVTRKSTSFE